MKIYSLSGVNFNIAPNVLQIGNRFNVANVLLHAVYMRWISKN